MRKMGRRDGYDFSMIHADLFRGMMAWMVLLGMLFVVDMEGSCMSTLIEPCKAGQYLTIDALRKFCGAPGVCGRKLSCEGMTVLLEGMIDYGNVFDKEHYPMLPYQKFLLVNSEHTSTIEVWIDCDRSEDIFKKIFQRQIEKPDAKVYLEGVVSAFDMPIMGQCLRDIKLVLTDKDSIQ